MLGAGRVLSPKLISDNFDSQPNSGHSTQAPLASLIGSWNVEKANLNGAETSRESPPICEY